MPIVDLVAMMLLLSWYPKLICSVVPTFQLQKVILFAPHLQLRKPRHRGNIICLRLHSCYMQKT